MQCIHILQFLRCRRMNVLSIYYLDEEKIHQYLKLQSHQIRKIDINYSIRIYYVPTDTTVA
jgi:hypothetical protein